LDGNGKADDQSNTITSPPKHLLLYLPTNEREKQRNKEKLQQQSKQASKQASKQLLVKASHIIS
jgi:hypothetical protein